MGFGSFQKPLMFCSFQISTTGIFMPKWETIVRM